MYNFQTILLEWKFIIHLFFIDSVKLIFFHYHSFSQWKRPNFLFVFIVLIIDSLKIKFVQALFVNGVCFNCRMIDRIRLTSRLDLLVFGLKSHSFAMRSHSVPGSISAVSATNCFSAFLHTNTHTELIEELNVLIKIENKE